MRGTAAADEDGEADEYGECLGDEVAEGAESGGEGRGPVRVEREWEGEDPVF